METRRVTITKNGEDSIIHVRVGANLREALLEAGFSPYTSLTKKLNCGGRGICATCGVWIHRPDISPNHWHDRLAKKYGYSRLSCQIQVQNDMSIEIDTEKKIWGSPRK